MKDGKSELQNLHLSSIQKLLNSFTQTGSLENSVPIHFKANPLVFAIEPQVPDIWLKTRFKFDKNLCFFGQKAKMPNYFPKYIFQIGFLLSFRMRSSLKARTLSLTK